MTWKKSTASAGCNCCVWVDIEPDAVRVTYSSPDRRPADTMLRFTHAEWAAFLAGVKAGEFDLGADHG